MKTLSFGQFIREKRLELLSGDPAYSLRSIARACSLEPSFLSKIERGITPPPSEAKIKALAVALGLDSDILLALAGKVSTDLQEAIRQRPQLFGELIRQLKTAPNNAVEKCVKETRAKYC